jgi:hypothetical protein
MGPTKEQIIFPSSSVNGSSSVGTTTVSSGTTGSAISVGTRVGTSSVGGGVTSCTLQALTTKTRIKEIHKILTTFFILISFQTTGLSALSFQTD